MVCCTVLFSSMVTYNGPQVKKLLVQVPRAVMTDSNATDVSLYV